MYKNPIKENLVTRQKYIFENRVADTSEGTIYAKLTETNATFDIHFYDYINLGNYHTETPLTGYHCRLHF